MSRVVVVGGGMAGTRFVQELLTRTDRHQVTVVGDEPDGAYNRVQLSNVLAGRTRGDTIGLVPAGWYAEHGVRAVVGRSVVAVDRHRRGVTLDDGEVLPYDQLVLATGSTPVLPPAAGLCTDGRLVEGAALFRTLADCVRIDAWARRAGSAVVLGAGVLGLEAARGLAGRGVRVTLVQRGRRLMERQLDAEAGRTLQRSLTGLSIQVCTGAGLAEVHADDAGSVSSVTLADGRHIACDLLVLCCGVAPNVALAMASGLPVGRGVLVDDALRSPADPRVFAVGECAEHDGVTYGLVAPSWEQARVAAEIVAAPDCDVRYRGSGVVTRLKAADLQLATIGDTHPVDEDDVEIVRYSDTARGVYQKLVVRDGVLAGAILLGDTGTAGMITQLFDRAAPLPPDRAGLLMPRRGGAATAPATPTALPASATVCQCNGVSKGALVAAWQDGARSVDDLAGRTRATTGCGTCRETVAGIAEWLAAADPDDPAAVAV